MSLLLRKAKVVKYLSVTSLTLSELYSYANSCNSHLVQTFDDG